MSHSFVTPEERYAAVVAALVNSSDATFGFSAKKGFGSIGLASGGKLFAMLNKGRPVVKLPKERVDALIASGDGERFDPGHGRLMKK